MSAFGTSLQTVAKAGFARTILQESGDRVSRARDHSSVAAIATGTMTSARPLRWLIAPLALGALFAACGDDGRGGATGAGDAGLDFGDVTTDFDVGDAALDAPGAERCEVIDRATAVRARSAAGGHLLHLFLYDDAGDALDADYAACLRLEEERLGALPHVGVRATVEGGATLIVARWTPEEAEASRAFIDAWLDASAPGEQVAVWAWSDTLRQVVGATDDHTRIRRRLDATWTARAGEPMPPDAAASEAVEAWERFAEDVLVGPRDVIFVAPELVLDELPDVDRDFVVDWWVIGSAITPRSTNAAPEAAAADLSARYRERAETGMALLAFCDDGQELDLRLMVGERRVRRLTIGDAAMEHVGPGCDLEALLGAGPEPMPTLDVWFTPEQRASFDALAEARDGVTEFEGRMRLQAHEEAAAFRGSFRGQSSLACERKSWSVNLDGRDARHPIPGTGMDQFYLISMCLDDRYVNQVNADRLLARVGTWHLALGFVELRVDDASHGLYLFVEEVDDALRNDVSDARAVIRRRTDIDGKAPEAKWSFDDDDEAALARYEAFLASFEGLQGEELLDALHQRMDLDQYLRWIALMSLLENGDYVDEVFFVEEGTVDTAGAPASYYTIQTWDPDDLFSACHHNGRFAIEDPSTLLYCTESVLDHAIFADPLVYAYYVDTLEAVVGELTPEVFEATVTATRDELLAWFERDALRLAMVELLEQNPEAESSAVFQSEIEAATEALIEKFRVRRGALVAAIDAFRGAR